MVQIRIDRGNNSPICEPIGIQLHSLHSATTIPDLDLECKLFARIFKDFPDDDLRLMNEMCLFIGERCGDGASNGWIQHLPPPIQEHVQKIEPMVWNFHEKRDAYYAAHHKAESVVATIEKNFQAMMKLQAEKCSDGTPSAKAQLETRVTELEKWRKTKIDAACQQDEAMEAEVEELRNELEKAVQQLVPICRDQLAAMEVEHGDHDHDLDAKMMNELEELMAMDAAGEQHHPIASEEDARLLSMPTLVLGQEEPPKEITPPAPTPPAEEVPDHHVPAQAPQGDKSPDHAPAQAPQGDKSPDHHAPAPGDKSPDHHAPALDAPQGDKIPDHHAPAPDASQGDKIPDHHAPAPDAPQGDKSPDHHAPAPDAPQGDKSHAPGQEAVESPAIADRDDKTMSPKSAEEMALAQVFALPDGPMKTILMSLCEASLAKAWSKSPTFKLYYFSIMFSWKIKMINIVHPFSTSICCLQLLTLIHPASQCPSMFRSLIRAHR